MLKVCCPLVGIALFVIGAQQLHRAACDQRVSIYAFINSDTLTCAAFYEDVVLNGYPISGFYFPTNNVMFPDCFIYFVARSITGSTAPAMILCTCILLLMQLAGFYFVMHVAAPSAQRTSQTCILIGMSALFLLVNARTGLQNPFFRLPIILTYHAGANVCVLFGLALLLYLVKAEEWGRRHRLALAALFVDATLGMTSDRLIIIQLFIPVVAAMVLTRVLAGGSEAGLPLKKAGMLTMILCSSAMSGQQLLRIFQPPWQDVINHYPFNLDNGWKSLCMLAEKWKPRLKARDPLHWFVILWTAGCFVHLGRLAYCRFRAGESLALTSTQRSLLFVSAHYLVMTVTCVLAVCFSGLIYDPPYVLDFDWGGAARYFIPVLFMPFFLIGLWLAPLQGWASRRLPCVAMACLFVFVSVGLARCSRIPRNDDQAVWNYYPPAVQRLDAIAADYDLEYGLAGYWEAKVMMLLSHRHVRVHGCCSNPGASTRMTSFHWLSNGRCYFDPPRGKHDVPRYDFMLVKEFAPINTPSRGELIQRFGQPAASVPCGPYHVFIYNRPEDVAFRDLVNRECYFLRGRFQFGLGESIRFEADTLPSGILGPYPPDERLAIEGCVPPGLLSGGPLLHMREKGTYRIKVVTSSPEGEESSGTWKIFLINPKRDGPSTLVAEGAIEPGTMKEVVVEALINNRRLGRAIECQVFYNGEGMLQMHHVEVTRIR